MGEREVEVLGYNGVVKEKLLETSGCAGDTVLDLPHGREKLSVKIVTSKIKAIRLKYRQAVDKGKRSGQGEA